MSARPSSYAEKRRSGMAADSGSNASSRTRNSPMSDGNAGFRSHASRPSDPKASSRFAADHKRSTSGTPNARSTTNSFEERRTERVKVTTRETLIARTKSPQRRSPRHERTKTATPKRPSEPRRDARQETPVLTLGSPTLYQTKPTLLLTSGIYKINLCQWTGNPRPLYYHTRRHPWPPASRSPHSPPRCRRHSSRGPCTS